MNRKVLSFLLTIALVFALAPLTGTPVSVSAAPTGDWITDGSPATPAGILVNNGSTTATAIQITSGSELAWLAQQVNGGTDFSGKYIKLMNGLDLSAHYWVPIGDYTYPFKGTFLGNSTTISGLTVDGNYNYAGLFGYIYSGAISDLHIGADCSVGSPTVMNAGSIAGGAQNMTITGCSNEGDVEAGSQGYAGGIVGSQDTSQIQSCWNKGTITGTDSYIGGIAGYSGGGNCMIQQCYNSGSLDNAYSNGGGMAGGIVGFHDNYGTVQNCYNTGSIEIAGGSGSECYAGGIAGGQSYYNVVKIEYCYNTGSVAGNGGGTRIGGIVGDNELYGYPVLRFCAALNESVSAGSTACRIGAGTNYSDNYALRIMKVKINGVDKTITAGLQTEDGADLSADLLKGSWWSNHGWSGVWTFPDADVPGVPILKDVGGTQTTALPGFTASAVPAVSTATVAKISVSQAAISFALTNTPAYANGQIWKVYDALTGGSLVGGVTASNVGNTLTLTHATDISVGTYYVSVTETGKTESTRLALTVGSPQPPTITTASLPDGTVGTAYSQSLSASGATPIVWTVTAGTLPNGLTLSGTTISGTPTVASTFSFTVKAESTVGSNTKNFTITISPAPPSGGGGGGGGSNQNEMPGIKTTVSGNTATVNIPKAALEQAANGKNELKLSTPVASLSFDTDALSTIFGEASGDVKIIAAKVDTSSLTDDTKELIGDRPVFNFSVTSGNGTISEFGGNVTVAVPYTPKAGEDPDSIVIYYINADGKPEAVANCKYDPVTKTMTFTTSHFSKYVVGYNKVSFSDVKAGAWYGNAVEFAAARGIVTGTGSGCYSPDGKLTRAQLLVMLMRAYGIEPDTNPSNNFSDAGNTYYTGYLAAAKRLGITEGLGNNLYAPERQITRQEMFTLLYNTLKVIGQLPEGTGKTSGALTGYSDADSVASWAKDASGTLADAGIVGGSNGKLSPKNTTTRVEMAQVLYNLLSK
jgi:hypothetical protein